MERKHHWWRLAVAVCLSLLFSFSSLAALTIQSFTANEMSCCRKKVVCCCHKHEAGPEFSAKSCARNCGTVTLGSTVLSSDFALRAGTSTPVFHSAAVKAADAGSAPSVQYSRNLQQRPPPVLSIVS